MSEVEKSTKNRALLLFKDDSSLMSAVKLERILGGENFTFEYCYAHNSRHGGRELSERQINLSLEGRKVDYTLEIREASDERFLEKFDTVYACKYPGIFKMKWVLRLWNFKARRPCFVSSFPGIEFTPKSGIRARQYSDVVCLNTVDDVSVFRKFASKRWQKNTEAIQFSPFFFSKNKVHAEAPVRNVVFFSQSVMPESREGRVDVLGFLVEAARLNPGVLITIKLRHLENENKVHTHKEQYSYPSLLREEFPLDAPENLVFSADSMEKILEECDFAVTVASTAGVEALGSGIPTLFLGDFMGIRDEWYHKALIEFVGESGLLGGKEDLLSLRPSRPDEAWYMNTMSTEDHVKILTEKILGFDHGKAARGEGYIGKLLPQSLKRFLYSFL
ncbi:DUF6716 putative glycosyltransferase [Sneathiella chinensis]|uniref:DUF6716 putative glycosyltransferase n=1 Tax=Sneathiella chinensis TaxID=349750 RepID=UPI00146ACC6D|nr:DUF6716 putative glycosyltransferase [Sneathiella chinensis]